MLGRKVIITQATQSGTETIIGTITTPMEENWDGEITHITVEGKLTHETITSLPLPIEAEEERNLILIPISNERPHLLNVEILSE